MWRLQGLLTRALNRFHAANVPVCVHGEAEALNPSSLIPLGQNAGAKSSTFSSPGSQRRQNGQDQKRKGRFQYSPGQLPQCTILDAFGWGAIAVIFLQLTRHVAKGSCPNSTKEDRTPRSSYLNKILCSLAQSQKLSIRSHIVPNGTNACCWNGIGEARPQADDLSQNLCPSSSLGDGVLQLGIAQDESQTGNTSSLSDTSASPGSDADSEAGAVRSSDQEQQESEIELGESLQFAASRLLDVTESSAPVALNIFGIVSARDHADYSTAFHCFQESAESGYSKAQYNTAVCYEKGRGITKDTAKAAEYYLLAAKSGHHKAQYRYARYLLHSQAESTPENVNAALQMLNEAAQAGLMEAQAFLGVLYSRDIALDPPKAVRYLWMAAENGDAQSRYYLGVCYERGFGVPVSQQEARRHYKRAAKTGHGQAQQKLSEMQEEQGEGQGSRSFTLRGTASSPCLPVLERSSMMTRPSKTYISSRTDSLGLPHSMSAGNLLVMSTDSRGCNLLPVHMTHSALPHASLRAIGVG